MKTIMPILLFIFYAVSMNAQNPLWLRYPAISPDGSTIAFEFKGDIYTVPSSGGAAKILTTSSAYDYAPVWSNDGSKIAFASDRYGNMDVFIMSAQGGSATRLTWYSTGDKPTSFSPDNSRVYFQSTRLDDYQSSNFPVFAEFYSVPAAGGREVQELTMPVINARSNKAGDKIIYEDRKGYEFYWRKHHTSSVTRDLWLWNKSANTFTQLTTYSGEDLFPNWSPDERSVLYVSEEDGTANIWSLDLNNPASKKQITRFQKNPVRFLTVAQTGKMCFTYDGEIYTSDAQGNYAKVMITVQNDDRYTDYTNETLTGGATEFALSPDGKTVAFIVRGEVFAASVESGATKRITQTPGQERSVSFSPDGKKILYASERNNIWGVYQTNIINADEPYFFNATLLNEDSVVVGEKEAFQPRYAPTGDKIAYLEERTTLKVYDVKTKQSITVLPADKNYSYADGDQYYDWSPDGNYLLVQFLNPTVWIGQIGVIRADGKGSLVNLIHSGYDNFFPKWSDHGKSMIWFTSKYGLRNHANSGAQVDVYQMFFTQDAFDRSKLSKEELDILTTAEQKEKDEKAKKEEEAKKGEENKKDKKGDKEKKDSVAVTPIQMDTNNLRDRTRRLTINSSFLADAVMTPDGEQLFYLAKFEKGWDLWSNKMRDQETKLFLKLGAESAGGLTIDSTGKNLFFMADGAIVKVSVDAAERKNVSFSAEMDLNRSEERSYMFEHIWRQVTKKFYVTDLHGVDWNYYKATYEKFLPYINNNYDFSEMVSEMLGELNCSHTGCYYRSGDPNGDNTASLGLYPDNTYSGKGLKVGSILEKGPLDKAGTKIKPGVIITAIDGTEITPETNYYALLNRKAGKPVLLSLKNESVNAVWTETVKPIDLGTEHELAYQRWIKMREKETDSLSGGRVGYVHVRGMDDGSFREVFDKVLGEDMLKDALIVDTRYNGGGWLHDDLATFLSGSKYVSYVPRGQQVGMDPYQKWCKPSVVIMNEANYSDAHMFPFAYKTLGIGKLVGMPVAGTGTAVWWESLQDPSLVFGIPEVGVVTNEGKYLENNQLEPDIKFENTYKASMDGRDEQIEAAVKELMKK